MDTKPQVRQIKDGKLWEHTFESFKAKVYIPTTDLPEDIINFGFEAPYNLIFTENEMNEDEIVDFSIQTGLTCVAKEKATSIVFITPTCEGGWKCAKEGLFEEIIANSKIHEYHEDGMAILINRFTKGCDGYAIRGAIFRTYVYATGSAADYVATYMLQTLNGEGLWGPADVTPTVCILDGLSVMPNIGRRDMPVVSINNTEEINAYIRANTELSYIVTDSNLNLMNIYKNFAGKYMRWGWVGDLNYNADFEAINMQKEWDVVELTTSKDNKGDDAKSLTHKVGYLAYYNKGIMDNKKVPLVMAFHGGGDSATHIAQVSEWYKVAHDHDFLLVCVEDHLNSTATEMQELIDYLIDKYNIDTTRIYASGFSMGGCKSWDLFQEYPERFAGIAPMSATFDVGNNIYDDPAPKAINRDVLVPVFYVGGEISPLPELPFQAQKCTDRTKYVLEVNDVVTRYEVEYEKRDTWANKIYGIDGDTVEKIEDKVRNSVLTLNYFKSKDGNIYTAFGSVSDQGHECRYHSCENAWLFISKFSRVNGQIVIKNN